MTAVPMGFELQRKLGTVRTLGSMLLVFDIRSISE